MKFTYEQVIEALVLVEPIVLDIMRKRKGMGKTKEGNSDFAKSIMYNLRELEQIGCFLRDFSTGHVQFPSENGYFDWMVGDSEPFIQKKFKEVLVFN